MEQREVEDDPTHSIPVRVPMINRDTIHSQLGGIAAAETPHITPIPASLDFQTCSILVRVMRDIQLLATQLHHML